MNQIIPIASDHGGYEMKQFLIEKLEESGYTVKDYGTHSTDSVDYPDMIHPYVRAALCWNEELAELARKHNDANILSLPGRFIPFDQAWRMVQVFLNTPFEGGRHARRIEKIEQLA